MWPGYARCCCASPPRKFDVTAANRLAGWLAQLESRHPKAIDLGLERIDAVRVRLGLEPAFPLITVGGTNGKGSVCAYLEAILAAAGYRVGVYTSPHLLRYNERVRIGQSEVDDTALVEAFEAVEAARGETSLTYFEQGTLAAMWLFMRQGVQAAVLEVGLGGRLDAVNIWDADCAVVTSVDLDHQDYLGPDREAIGREKAGILRPGRPAVCADRTPPRSLLGRAEEIGAELLRLGHEIQVDAGAGDWTCRIEAMTLPALPYPGMPGVHQLDNAAAALAALGCVRARLPVSEAAIHAGLRQARQPGRFQVIAERPRRILDVAHNPHAARALAENLRRVAEGGTVHAVFAMLSDKDIAGVIAALREVIGHWHVAGLDLPRGTDAAALTALLQQAGVVYSVYPDVETAWSGACEAAGAADTIAAFGSFHTVAKIMALTTARAYGQPDT